MNPDILCQEEGNDREMEQTGLVKRLFHQAVHIFAQDPYVSDIFLFGSYEKKTYDSYSDVDLHVVSQNFDATMKQLWHTLSAIGQVLVAFPLAAEVGHAAYMVIFENYPLYTKLDINISDTLKIVPFAEKTCVYHSNMLPPNAASTFRPALFEEPLNTLYGYYLGAIRYMKYRKREKHFSAYKFYRAQLDHFLLRWYQDISHERSVSRLGILEYQMLDTREESTALKRYLYPENEQTMDRLYLELLQTMTDELKPQFDEQHNKTSKVILHFLRHEAGEEEI
jgi:predicted nucleotidyltransferase